MVQELAILHFLRFDHICYFHNSNRLLELIHESKSLLRLGIQLPESAEDVLKQVPVIESEYKMYKCSL